MHFTTRNFKEVTALVAEMRRKKIPFTTRSTLVCIKAALKTNDFEEAVNYFRQLKEMWALSADISAGGTPSQAPKHIISQLVELACKEHQLARLLPELKDAPLGTESLNGMFTEALRQKNFKLVTS